MAIKASKRNYLTILREIKKDLIEKGLLPASYRLKSCSPARKVLFWSLSEKRNTLALAFVVRNPDGTWATQVEVEILSLPSLRKKSHVVLFMTDTEIDHCPEKLIAMKFLGNDHLVCVYQSSRMEFYTRDLRLHRTYYVVDSIKDLLLCDNKTLLVGMNDFDSDSASEFARIHFYDFKTLMDHYELSARMDFPAPSSLNWLRNGPSKDKVFCSITAEGGSQKIFSINLAKGPPTATETEMAG